MGTINPGNGYRLLEDNEVIKVNDEFLIIENGKPLWLRTAQGVEELCGDQITVQDIKNNPNNEVICYRRKI